MPVSPGDAIAVTQLVEWMDEATGFWCARSWGDTLTGPLVRVYWSVRSDQAGFVLSDVTDSLDGLQLRYSLKCPALASGYARVDSFVVYLEAETWKSASHALKAVAKRARSHLRSATPPLTKRIAYGMAFAEDPGDSLSFGESRCRALAPGALSLLGADGPPRHERLAILSMSLQTAGIDVKRPWLNPARHEHA
jgi:hypothetical protein